MDELFLTSRDSWNNGSSAWLRACNNGVCFLDLETSFIPIQIQIFNDHESKIFHVTKELNMQWRRWVELIKNYDYVIDYHPSKAKIG